MTSDEIVGHTAGTYCLTVTDANTCALIPGCWVITEPPALSIEHSITHVDCYGYSTGAICITASGGTPPYSYAWGGDTGSGNCITGLVAGTYYVTVTDAHTCNKIGGPFIVTEPPAWSTCINGPTLVCQCTSGVAYSVCDPNSESFYEWDVTGGTIISGWNTPYIIVDWACCPAGKVCVTETRKFYRFAIDQLDDFIWCTHTTCIDIDLKPIPAPIISGPASVTANQQGVVYCTPDFIDHYYTWDVVGGTIVGGWGTHCITVNYGPYPPCGCGHVQVCESYDPPLAWCTGCDEMSITILPENQENIYGYITYNNDYGTPLNGVAVHLRNPLNGTVVATTYTGPNMNPPNYTGAPGYFAFTNIPNGTYRIMCDYNGAWGGNNATDALIIQLNVIGSWPLTYLRNVCADVNASTVITGLDALYVKLRTVGMINSYPAGDWMFTDTTFVLNGTANFEYPTNIKGLCVGDVNGSYIPTGLKDVAFLSAIEDGIITIPTNQSFNYVIRSNKAAELGAMTLFLGFDQTRFDVEDITTSLEGMKYVIANGQISLAWSDTKSLSINSGDVILTLRLKAKETISQPSQIFTINPGSEFADIKANKYDNFDLKMSSVVTPTGSQEFYINNFPNPFQNTTDVVYVLLEQAHVKLVLTNMYGEIIHTLVNADQTAGSYKVKVDPSTISLNAGVYLYKIEVNGVTTSFNKTNKMVFTR